MKLVQEICRGFFAVAVGVAILGKLGQSICGGFFAVAAGVAIF